MTLPSWADLGAGIGSTHRRVGNSGGVTAGPGVDFEGQVSEYVWGTLYAGR